MANSRLEKIGTIYSRTRGLIQSGAMSYTDRPLWFDLYESFPPKEEPRFDRTVPNMKIKGIFFDDDKIRAQLHKKVGRLGVEHLLNNNNPSFTQKFINTYKSLEGQYGVGQCEPEQLCNEALDVLKSLREVQQAESKEDAVDGTITRAFKNATKQQRSATPVASVNLKDLFKEE